MLCLPAEPIGSRVEPMQMAVGPAERHLNDVVQLIEEEIRCQFKPTPQRRVGALKIDPHRRGAAAAANGRGRRLGLPPSAAGRTRANAVLRPSRQASDFLPIWMTVRRRRR